MADWLGMGNPEGDGGLLAAGDGFIAVFSAGRPINTPPSTAAKIAANTQSPTLVCRRLNFNLHLNYDPKPPDVP